MGSQACHICGKPVELGGEVICLLCEEKNYEEFAKGIAKYNGIKLSTKKDYEKN